MIGKAMDSKLFSQANAIAFLTQSRIDRSEGQLEFHAALGQHWTNCRSERLRTTPKWKISVEYKLTHHTLRNLWKM